MTVWSPRSGRNCSMRFSARLGRLSVGACAAEGWFEPGGVQRADAFGQEDGVPVGQGSVGQVAGWTSAAPIEGDVAGPGGPRVDPDAGERLLIVNILGRQVGDARTRIDGRGSDVVDRVGQTLLAWCRKHEGGSDARVAQAPPRGVPVKVEQGRVGEDAHDRVGARGLGELINDGHVGAGQGQR